MRLASIVMYRHLRRGVRVARKAFHRRIDGGRSAPYRVRFPEVQLPVESGARFFADFRRLAELAHALRSSNSPWVMRALEKVRSDRIVGLDVYTKRAPPLDGLFPWGGLEKGPGSDVLYAVRPHRFAFAPRFALAILYEDISPEVLSDILQSWIAFAKSGTSNYPYISTLVVIQRSLALSWAYAFVSAASESESRAGTRLRSLILKILRADIEFLFPRLGTGHPNNHLLVERFAAWYFVAVFPELAPPRQDPDQLEKAFVDELLRQTYPDGGGFEHSLHYHEFGCEMAAAYLLLCRRVGHPVPKTVAERVRRMLEFQVELAGPECVTLAYGNGTEDPLFPLDAGEGYATAALRELHRSLFCPHLSAPPPSADSLERAFWLLGGDIAPGSEDSATSTGVTSWLDSGFQVLAEARGSARMVFRSGPSLSCASMPGHMHADLLSVYLSSGAQPFLVDAGTWSYRTRAADDTVPGRRYFAGPSAHNTLSIEGFDPLGELQGDFREGELRVRVRRCRFAAENRIHWTECEVVGESAYSGRLRGVVHVEGHYWIVYDRLPSSLRGRSVRLKLQMSPSVRCRLTAHDFAIAEGTDDRLWIAKGSTLKEARVACGELKPPSGWVSPRYGELVPAAQLSYTLDDSRSSAALVFGFGCEGAFPVDVEEVDGSLAIRSRREASTDLLIVASGNERVQLFEGGRNRREADLVWCRRSADEVDLRMVASRSPQYPSGAWETAVNDSGRPHGSSGERFGSAKKVDSAKRVSIVFGGREWQ